FRHGYRLAVNQCNCPLREREIVYQFANNWTKIQRNHNLKWGADVRRAQNIRIPSDRRRNGKFPSDPSLTGSAGVTGSGLGPAAFLLGMPGSFERFAQTATDAEDIQWRMFYFVQDNWRVTQKFTLTLGLRWDTWFPNFSRNPGQGSQYDVTTNNVIVAGVGANGKAAGIETQWTNFSPRLAIAYQWGSKSVIRTGFGRSFFQEIFGATFNNTANNYPTLITQQVRQSIPLNQAEPGPGPFNPRRLLFTKFGLTQSITDASTKGSNNYHALQAKLDKRFSRGLSLLASYTWSKTINNSQGLQFNGGLN